jgi:predicted transcriptional regulator of viral defense system
MNRMPEFFDTIAANGRYAFSKQEAMEALRISAAAFLAAAERQQKKGRIVSPRQGFYLLLRPEDRAAGAPDPACWIDPLMEHLGIAYRVSLLRAAAHHGASHQAAMSFQVIVPKQLKQIELGRQRIDFVYQRPAAFLATNRREWLTRIKTDAGYAKAAGVELTLLDSARYPRSSGGLGGLAQMAHDLGGKASPPVLKKAAAFYESSAVRRLGYLLASFGHRRQAEAFRGIAAKAKSNVLLDPALKPLPGLEDNDPVDETWRLVMNASVEIDT